MLVVCTANVIRSPVIALLLMDRLRGTGVTVSSAGVSALEGRPMATDMRSLLPPGLVGAAATLVSRHLTKEMVLEADVVITATREQRAAVVTLVPTALQRTFTLGEFAAWSQELAREPTAPPVDTLHEVVQRIPRVRATRRIADDEFDLEDPRGRSKLVFRRIYTLIDTRTGVIAEGLLTLAGGPAATAPR